MAYPKILYVRSEADDDGTVYYAAPTIKDGREEGGEKVQRLAVYTFSHLLETEEKIEVREVGKEK